MHQRSLAVAAVAGCVAIAVSFGMPSEAAASGPAYNALIVSPLPIEQPGLLHPANAGGNTVTMCVQPQENGAAVAVGATVYLSIDSGLFANPPSPGGSAMSGSTALAATPQAFLTTASCSYATPDGVHGAVSNAVPVTYLGPNPVRATGRDVVAAESDTSSFDLATGQCVGPGVCATGTYVFSPVAGLVFSHTPIAATGSLVPHTSTIVTVTALDDSTPTPQPIPGAFIDLSLTSSAASGGTVTAVNTFAGLRNERVTNNPTRFGADIDGSITITYATPAALPSVGTDTIAALARSPTGGTLVNSSSSYTYAISTTPLAGGYTAVAPFRICDTRPVAPGIAPNQCNTGRTGAGEGPIQQGATRVVTIDGVGGLPGSGITAVAINVTAIAPSEATYLTLFPDGVSKPGSSNINPQAGSSVANLAEIAVSAGGKIDLFNALGAVNVALDVEGYVSSGSTGLYTPVAAARICDTRVGAGIATNQCNQSGASPIRGGDSLSFNVHTASDGIPATGVSAVVFNLTAIDPTQTTVLTAYPSDVGRPNVSNVNLKAGTAVPNRVIVRVSTTGLVSIWNGIGSVNVAVDVDGWFGSGSGARFTALTPARVCNTQVGNGNVAGCTLGSVAAGRMLTVDVTGVDGVPQFTGNPGSPVAVVMNVTAVNATSATFATVYLGYYRPNTSDLNVPSFEPVTNLVVVPVGLLPAFINIFNALGNINFIVDVLGYYS